MTLQDTLKQLIDLASANTITLQCFNAVQEWLRADLSHRVSQLYYDSLMGCLMIQCGNLWLGIESDCHIHS